jgi:hypothetical protein
MIAPIHDLERSYGNFPREHQYASLESLEQTPDNPELDVFFSAAEKLVAQWDGNKFAGLYLYGEPGTGKTHAAVGLTRALHENGASINYRHVPSWKPFERSVTRFDKSVEIIPPHITDWLGARAQGSGREVPPFPTTVYEQGHQPVHEKSVLLLDDYRPFARDYVATAIEAASEYGGLVIVTSNYTDPFKIIEETPGERAQEALYDSLSETDPRLTGLANVVKSELSAKRDALRSRVAAAFKFIHFEGRDRRVETSFWND